MSPAVQRAIVELYKCFATTKPAFVPWCTCKMCEGKANVPDLLSKPLRSLSADDLSDYSQSVF